MARIKDTSVDAVKAAADFVEVVSAAHPAAQGRRALHGPLPVPRGANAVVLGQRRRQALLLLRLRREGRPDHVRPRDRRARLRRIDRVARRALPSADRVRGELARARPGAEAARAPVRAPRPGGDVLRADAVGLAGRRDGARLPQGTRAERGGVPRVPARPRARWHQPRPQGTREGLHPRRVERGRAVAAAWGGLFPAAPALPARRRPRPCARVPGAPPARGRPTAREVREHARVGAVPQGLGRLRARPLARRDREGGSRLRRRGQHRRARAAPGRVRAGRRVHGHRAHRTAPEGARPADEAPLARLRRRRRGRDRNAARHGARRPAGLRRQGRAVAARRRSRRRPLRLRGASREGRAVPRLSRTHRDRPCRRPRERVPNGEDAARGGG